MERRRGIETERRFLIAKPGSELLAKLGENIIEQTYIRHEDKTGADADLTERVRSWTHGGETTYTHTVKRRLGRISSDEDEEEITRGEFESYLTEREAGTSTIRKTRYVMPYRGYKFEIDVFDEWERVALMEVELPDVDANVELPPEISVIREISGDRSLSNHALSRRFPSEKELLGESVSD